MGKYFGTDGIRGVFNETIDSAMSFKIGAFLGQYGKKNKILIAYDTRASGLDLCEGLVAGITSSGGDAVSIGVAPTPAVAYLVKKHGYDYGVMISASHNPFQYNGIKLFDRNGFKTPRELEQLVEDYLDNKFELTISDTLENGTFVYSDEMRQCYIDYVRDVYSDKKTFNVLIDGANGSAANVIKDILKGFKINATYINIEPNGMNINLNCGSTHLEALQEVIHANPGKYDLGVAFDGDADRVLFVGRSGNVLDGDHTIYLLSKYYKEIGGLTKDTAVVTVMANYGLFLALEELGVKTVITDVGDKYVQAEIVKNDYLIGGEQSGHIIFNGVIKSGDGIYTFLKVLEVLGHKDACFEEYVSEFKKYPQHLLNIKVADKSKVLSHHELWQLIDELEKGLNGKGRILVRPSGTEPLFRVMVETSTHDQAVAIAEQIAAKIRLI